MDILIKILQLLLSLTILVLVHEFGHFFFAKLFKTRVEKFYLFFDPWFSLIKYTKKGTEYGIGWIPLGGYVKISGMIDESMDKEQLKKPPQEWEFRSKKTWQRFLIMIGGVSFNVLLAIAIFIFTLYVWGENFLPNANVTNGIAVDSVGKHLGLRNGDKILSVDKQTIKDFSKIPAYIILNDAKTIQVLRDNKTEEIVLPSGYISKLIKHNSPEFLTVRVPFEIADFAAKSPARDGGLKINDKIIGIDTIKTLFFDEFRAEIVKHKKQIVNIKAIRGADTIIAKIHVNEKGLIGVRGKTIDYFYKLENRNYSFLQSIPAGTIKTYKMIGDYLKQLKLIFSPETKAYESLGGFISIGKIFPGVWDWHSFWGLTAFLSIILAIMNILPIPALDGGHLLFLIYEIITGRKPSDKFLEYAQIGGMIILFALLIFANGNDIIKLFRN